MRIFRLHSQLCNYRLLKIGFSGHQLFVSPVRLDCIDIWSIHSFIPDSWQKLLHLPLLQLLYSFYALSETEPYIYALIVALFDCDVPHISIVRVNTTSGEHSVYNLDDASGEEFENNVFLENVVLSCAGSQLYMYERSVVMGPIPFWLLSLNEETSTFTLVNRTIPAEDDEQKCSRYPIVVDGERRMVFKLNDNHGLRVFDGTVDEWSTYSPSPDTYIDLTELRVKGVCETYGRSVHRIGAIESPLTFFTNKCICIAKIFSDNHHHFYEISFDSNSKQYRLRPLCMCRLPKYINQRFYATCTSTLFAFIGSAGIAFIALCPPKLRELAFLALQRQFSTIVDDRWTGGISEQNIKQICSMKNDAPLI